MQSRVAIRICLNASTLQKYLEFAMQREDQKAMTLRRIKARGQLWAFADDLAIMVFSLEKLEEALKEIRMLSDFSLEMNEKKCEIKPNDKAMRWFGVKKNVWESL